MGTRVVAVVFLIGCVFVGIAAADETVSRLLFEGRAAYLAGDYKSAEHYHRLAVKAAEGQGDNLELAETLGDLGGVLLVQGQHDESLEFCLKALNILRTAKSERHLRVVLNYLGVLSREAGDYAQSEKYFKESVRTARKITPPDIHEGRALNNLATLYYIRQDYGRAERTLKDAIKAIERQLGADNEELGPVLSNLAAVYVTMKKWTAAEPLFARALTLLQDTSRLSTRLSLAGVLDNMGMMHHEREKFPEAEAALRKAYDIRQSSLGSEHAVPALTGMKLGRTLAAMGSFQEAERLYAEALKIFEMTPKTRPLELAATLDATAALFRQTNRPQAAEPLENRARAIRYDQNHVVPITHLR